VPVESPGAKSSAQAQAAEISKAVAVAFSKEEAKIIHAVSQGVSGNMQTVCREACATTVGPFMERVSRLESGQQRLEEGQKVIGGRIEEVLNRLAKLETAVTDRPKHSQSAGLLAEPSRSQEPDVTTYRPPGFFMDLDPKTLFCNIHEGAKVPQVEFVKSIVALGAEANIPDSAVTVVGDPLDNRLEVVFDGPSAKSYALQFYQSLQLGRGKWKDQICKDANGDDNRFYASPDKNPAMVKKELLAKELKGLLVDKVGGSPSLSVKPPGPFSWIAESCAQWWCPMKRMHELSGPMPVGSIQLGLDEATVNAAFLAVVAGEKCS